ncbi:hypothetical protein F4604DRAFT_1919057 [Suillus subluteus]|nr:hypothetical protein F4604DRAFT_1919057 [Suillus subluteus]
MGKCRLLNGLLGHVPEQGSMITIMQSCLECLDQLDGMMDCVHKETLKLEIMEVRAHFTELLASFQSQDLLPCDTSSLVSHELGAQPLLTQNGTYPEGQILPGCSARRDQVQQLPLPIVQSSQHKVKCTWHGCSTSVKKGNLTCHVNETHWRKIKAFCADCGKGFTRPYMKKNHICRVKM